MKTKNNTTIKPKQNLASAGPQRYCPAIVNRFARRQHDPATTAAVVHDDLATKHHHPQQRCGRWCFFAFIIQALNGAFCRTP